MANNLNGLSGLYIGNRKVYAIYLGTYQQWGDDEPPNPPNPIDPDEPIEIQNPATIHNQVGFDIVICPNSRDSSITDITLPGIYGGEKNIVVEKGTYTIKECVMSGIDIGQTTYQEGDTIVVNSDITMSKHVYELPSGWDQELDEQYPIPQFDPDEPDEPDEPDDPYAGQYNGTRFTIQVVDDQNKTFSIGMGFTVIDESNPVVVDWGDGTHTSYNTSQVYGISHAYPGVGTYEVSIDDNISTIGISKIGGSNFMVNAEMLVGEVKLGDKINRLLPFCFAGCSNITRIVLPPSLTQIDTQVFYECHNLKEIISRTPTAPALVSNPFCNGMTGHQCGEQAIDKSLSIPENSSGYLDSEWKTVVADQLGYSMEYNATETPLGSELIYVEDARTYDDIEDSEIQEIANALIDISDESNGTWYVSPHRMVEDSEDEEEDV